MGTGNIVVGVAVQGDLGMEKARGGKRLEEVEESRLLVVEKLKRTEK